MCGVLQLRCATIADGGKFFMDFLQTHWLSVGRTNKELQGERDPGVDTHLSLHFSHPLCDLVQLVTEMIGFCSDVQALASMSDQGRSVHSCADNSTPSRAMSRASEKAHFLYEQAIRMQGGARGVGKGAIHKLRDAVSSPLALHSSGASPLHIGSSATRSGDTMVGQSDSDDEQTHELARKRGSIANAVQSVATTLSRDDSGHHQAHDVLRELLDYQAAFLSLLAFDAWNSMLASGTGAKLQAILASSSCKTEQKLAQQLEYCISSLPSNTDEWIRLFISAVQDVGPVAICICDMSMASAPIIHVNAGFEKMTGFSLEESVGHPCRFLQGAETNLDTIDGIRDAIRTATAASFQLMNYRKDGTTFLNMLTLRPIFDKEGHFVFMVRPLR